MNPTRFSDRTLRRWLRTGRPARVSHRLAHDPNLADRLERLTELDEQRRAALHALVQPTTAFSERTTAGVRQRIDTLETLGVIADMIGIGWRPGIALVDPEPPKDDSQSG